MTRTAKLADGTRLNFPDETTDDVMDATIARHVAESNKKSATSLGTAAAKDMGFGEKVAAGAGSAVENLLHSVGAEQLATMVRGGASRENIEDIEKGLGGAGTFGRIAGDVALTAIPGSKVAQGIGKVAPWLLKGTMAANAARAGVEGAVAGGLTSEDNFKGAAFGGVGGAALAPVLTKALGAFGKPVPQSAAADAARREGMKLSAGQGADPTTFLGKTWQTGEEFLSRVPLLGRALARQREAGGASVREKALDLVAGKDVATAARQAKPGTLDSIEEVRKQAFTTVYQDALRNKKIPMDETFENFVIKAINDPARYMSQTQRNFIEKQVEQKIFSQARNPVPTAAEIDPTLRIPGQALPAPGAAQALEAQVGTAVRAPRTAVGMPRAEVGPVRPQGPRPIKDIVEPPAPTPREGPYHDAETIFKGQSDLRYEGRRMGKGNLSEQATGKAMNDIADEVYRLIGRQDSGAGALIEKLRLPYTKLLAVEKAAKKAGGAGDFTPTQLRKASEGLSQEMEQFARRAEGFIPKADRAPTTTLGRAARSLMPTATMLGGGFLHAPATLATGAMLPVLGTNIGQKVLRGDTAAQRRLIDMLRNNPTLGSNIGGIGAAKYSERKR